MISQEIRQQAEELVRRMTNQQKAALLLGKDFWHLNGIPELGLPELMVTDGPHGLRKQVGAADHVGLNQSVPAVCFPTAATTACSFDPELLYEIGQALGEECLQEDVAVLLGPGVNHKRSPLCGRNFEYFSEDPYLTGKLAAAMVSGVQSKGIGTSLKHFAGNSQESFRLICDSVIDERALHELYLRQFEMVVRESQPATIMGAYNRLNGTYCCENKELLEEAARKQWGFEGLFVSDWGAVNDPVDSFRNGLDLEMPGLSKGSSEMVLEALERGQFSQETLDASARRLTGLILHHKTLEAKPYDAAAHLNLARKAAAESAVLLKNEGALPLRNGQTLAVVGLFAKHPRYQGAGSSKVNPIALDNAFDAFTQQGISFDYADGYNPDGTTTDALLKQARLAAAGKDRVVIFAGLPDRYESEGYDRENLELPDGHNRLIQEIVQENPNIVVVLQCGSCVTMPWIDQVNAVLMTYLTGCQGGTATVDLLTGAVNPSGKLAETFPLRVEDTPCAPFYKTTGKICQYRESIYTGYRYYDIAKKEVLFPFGHGLSYTSFSYGCLQVSQEGERVTVCCSVTNTGEREGRETVQLYISHRHPSIFKAEKELRRFQKVGLQPGETAQVSFTLEREDFAYYHVDLHDWVVEGGAYELRIGASSRDIRLSQLLEVAGNEGVAAPDYRQTAPVYYHPSQISQVNQQQFEALLGRPIPTEASGVKPFTVNVTMSELQAHSFLARRLIPLMRKKNQREAQDEDDLRQSRVAMMESPIRSIGMVGMHKKAIDGLIDILNGHVLRGWKTVRKYTKKND